MGKVLIPVLTALAVVAVMLYQGRTVEPVLCEAPVVRLPELAGFDSEPMDVSEAERKVLPADTQIMKRAYRSASGDSFCVSTVIGGRSKSSVHRPELCLPAQGFQMSDPGKLQVDDVEWHRVQLVRRDGPPMGFAYTFFNQDGFRTSSHFLRILRDVWDRSVHGRIDRWVMVTVHSSVADEMRQSAFLRKLKGELVK